MTSLVVTELSRISHSYFTWIFFKYLQPYLSYVNWPRNCCSYNDLNQVKTCSVEVSYCIFPPSSIAQLCFPPVCKKILMAPHHDVIPCKGSFGTVKKYLLKYLWNSNFTGLTVHWAQNPSFIRSQHERRKCSIKKTDFQRYFSLPRKLTLLSFFLHKCIIKSLMNAVKLKSIWWTILTWGSTVTASICFLKDLYMKLCTTVPIRQLQ